MKKQEIAKKMNSREDHLKSLQKKHGYSKEGTERYRKFFNMNRKGRESLNSPKKGQDNYSMEAKNEQEKE